MRAVVCNQFGPPEDLSVVELADPEPEPGQVLIEVTAASVTLWGQAGRAGQSYLKVAD